MTRQQTPPARGLGAVAVIMVLVVLASLAAAMVRLGQQTQSQSSQSLLGAHANAAARAGLREGDVILAIANTEVSSVKDFEAALAKNEKSKVINVLFRRGDVAQFALIRPLR